MGSMEEFWLTEMGEHFSTPGKTLKLAASGLTARSRPA